MTRRTEPFFALGLTQDSVPSNLLRLGLFVFVSLAGCGGRSREVHGRERAGGDAGAPPVVSGTGGSATAGGSGVGGGVTGGTGDAGSVATAGSGDTAPVDDVSACSSNSGLTLERASNAALPTLMLALDASAESTVAAPAGDTVWDETASAVAEVVANLPDGLPFGLITFPDLTTPQLPRCSAFERVMLGPLDANARAFIDSGLKDVEQPTGARDIDQALKIATSELESSRATATRSVILVTTGLPDVDTSCQPFTGEPTRADLAPLFDAVTAARQAGVPTYVVGTQGASGSELLSELATTGGTVLEPCADQGAPYSCYYDATVTNELEASVRDGIEFFARVELERAGCAVRIPDEINAYSFGVSLTDAAGTTDLPEASGTICANGWQLTSSDDGNHRSLFLCSNDCARYLADSSSRLVVHCGPPRHTPGPPAK